MRRTLTFVLVFLLSLAGFSIALANELNYINLPLHNDRAEVGTDCPSSGGPYWHFVITPNNGHSYFITFHLNLGDASTYDISVFIPNGGQLDNVFVAVPAGKTLESLNKTGSSADVYWDGEMQQPDKFTLSHVCPSAGYEALTVSKTVRTSYTRTHAWSLEKMVSPLDLYLYIPGQGASMPSTGVAVWTIDVNYEGYADSDWHISGQINITNTGTLDAVITGVNDVLAGIPIAVDCSVAFPYLLAQGETLTCIYDVDLTPPAILWSNGPLSGGVYYFGDVPAAPTCTAVDELSGPGSCTVTGYSASIGTHTLTATAFDKAGNTKVETRTYTVNAWTLKGFYQPVDMGGLWNTVKGGATVPLKFEIFAGATELTDVGAVYSITSAQVACTAGSEEAIEQVVTATGGTVLRYDSVDGQFIFNWQTPRKPGTCHRVTLITRDGSTLVAFFKLK